MRVTRLLEDPTRTEHFGIICQERFVSLLAKHKALLLQSDEGSDPPTVEDFAGFMEGLKLEKCEYLGGAGEKRAEDGSNLTCDPSICRRSFSDLMFASVTNVKHLRQRRGASFLSRQTWKCTPPTRHLLIN
jgi:hypothetical protein